MGRKTNFLVMCNRCGDTHTVKIHATDIAAWHDGELIQDAMPYLSAAERELLISGMCDPCFHRLFPE